MRNNETQMIFALTGSQVETISDALALAIHEAREEIAKENLEIEYYEQQENHEFAGFAKAERQDNCERLIGLVNVQKLIDHPELAQGR